MTEALPNPLVPQEVDLRDFQFTPIFRARLFGSSFHARSNDAEWRAGVTLWLKSWDQVPAGTLPDDDIDLCRLAELGRDMKGWKKVKDRALHGWTKCNDGRLHHHVVAQGVLEAWAKRSSAKQKGIAGASKRWGTAKNLNGTSNASAIAQAMPDDSKGEGIEGKGSKPTPPISPESNGKKKRVPRLPETPLPADFEVFKEMADWAKGKGLTDDQIDSETEKFIIHHKAKGSRWSDWESTWQKWILNAIKFGLEVKPPVPPKPPAEQPQLALRAV